MNDITQSKSRFFLDGQWLFVMLCFITFLLPLMTGIGVFENAWSVFWYEMLFVSECIIFRFIQKREMRLPLKSIVFWLLVAWLVSITISFVFSPYDLLGEWLAISRYLQTISHVLFCLCVMDFFLHYKGSSFLLSFVIPLSIFLLAFIFIGTWLSLDSPQITNRYFWFRLPPLNINIRITGFLITAAISALGPCFFQKPHRNAQWIALCFISLILWGFLFWCGGRAAILSVFVAYGFLFIILVIKKIPVKTFVITTFLFVFGGIVLSEWFHVLPWNGVFQAAFRTLEAGGDLYKLATGRPRLWGEVVESINQTHTWAFGLGSQGYYYMSNHTFGLNPHNLIFQFLAEWGLVGVLLFSSLLIYGFIKGLKFHVFNRAKEPSQLFLATGAIIVSLGFHSLVSGIFYHSQPSFYMALAFAVWMVPQKKSR